MCLQPRKVLNGTKCLRPSDADILLVPCQDCEECRYIRRTEYAFRIYEEMQKNIRRGWNNFFFTLTYNDVNLPRVSFSFKGYNYNNVPVFRKSDIIRFFKNIREYVLRTYSIKGISWICCPEYGSHTQRPHYHCYLALPLESEEVHRLLVRFWRNSVCYSVAEDGSQIAEFNFRRLSCTSDLGFVYPRDFRGGLDSNGYFHKPLQIASDGVQSSAHYVAKYCTKDMNFYKKPEIKAFIAYCKSSSLPEIKKLHREHIFGVLCSNHFGESINDYVKSISDLVNGLSTSFRSGRLTQVPSYNRRKLLNITRSVADDPSIRIVDDGYVSIEKISQRSTGYYHSEKQIIKDGKIQQHNIYEKGNFDPLKKSKLTNVYKPNFKYKVRYDLTQLGKDVAPSFFDSCVIRVCDTLRLFLSEHVFTREFELYYNSHPRQHLLSHFLRLVDFRFIPHIKDIAFYSVAYRGRVSPLHLQAFLDDSDIFARNSYSGIVSYYNENGALVSPDGLRSYFCSFAPVARVLYPIKWTSCKSYRFLGSESLSTMSKRAKSFYLSSLCFDKYVDEEKIDVKSFSYIDYVHFNSFPCYRGFDFLLDLCSDFYSQQKELDLTIIQQYQDQVSMYKQQLSENDY